MPRNSIKGGNIPQAPGQAPDNTIIFLLIGLCIFLLPIIGLVGYYGVYLKTCQDKDDDDKLKIDCATQLPGTTIKPIDCVDNVCTPDNCCVEKNCLPPTNLPPGYKLNTSIIGSLSTMSLKSRTGFTNGRKDLKEAGVDCDTSGNYVGSPIASTCGNNVNWTLSGCSKDNTCLNGENPEASSINPGTRPRSPISGGCSNIDGLSHVSSLVTGDGSNHAKCDSQFHKISENKSVFCKLDLSGLDACADTTATCTDP